MEDLPTRSLHETLAAGIGGEATDRVLRSSNGSTRPLWLLKPLPLQEPEHTAPSSSLQSACLTVLSREFHNFRPPDLRNLPPHLLRRLMSRITADRGYAGAAGGSGACFRPDEGTIWGFIAVNDAEGAAQFAPTHTVALPTAATLQHLPPSNVRVEDREHPLVELPRMFKEVNAGAKFTFLSTLTLDGRDVDDGTVQALKWCTNLTVLWMRNTRVTDDGVRMLSMALELPADGEEEGKGMWRLRALYLAGSRRISDRSMRSFARWPGLSVLDIRDTSCTEAAVGIANRTSAALFDGLQPAFQPCTMGLRGLFARTNDPEAVLDNLVLTLLKPDIPREERDDDHTRRHLSLHVIPGPTPPPEYLHDPVRPLDFSSSSSQGGHFVAGGTGTVWGKKASYISSDVESKRGRVQWALNFQAHEAEVQRAVASGKKAPKSWWEKDQEISKKQRKEFWSGVQHVHGWNRVMNIGHVAGKVFYQKEIEEEFEDDGEVKGLPDLMLVRMVHPEWTRLQYPKREDAASMLATQTQTQVRRARGTDAVDLLLLSQIEPSLSQTQRHAPSSPYPRSSSPISPPSELLATPPSSPGAKRTWTMRPPASQSQDPAASQAKSRPRPPPRNPFAAKPVARTSSGVRKLAEAVPTTEEPKPRDPLAFLDKKSSRAVDPLAFIEKKSGASALDTTKTLPKSATPSLASKPKVAAKPTQHSQMAKLGQDRKRKAETAQAAPAKRTLTDFFARKA